MSESFKKSLESYVRSQVRPILLSLAGLSFLLFCVAGAMVFMKAPAWCFLASYAAALVAGGAFFHLRSVLPDQVKMPRHLLESFLSNKFLPALVTLEVRGILREGLELTVGEFNRLISRLSKPVTSKTVEFVPQARTSTAKQVKLRKPGTSTPRRAIVMEAHYVFNGPGKGDRVVYAAR